MLVVVQRLSYGVKVLDTDDGVTERCTFTRLEEYIRRGIRVYGARLVRDGSHNVFLDFSESYAALRSIGYLTEVIRR